MQQCLVPSVLSEKYIFMMSARNLSGMQSVQTREPVVDVEGVRSRTRKTVCLGLVFPLFLVTCRISSSLVVIVCPPIPVEGLRPEKYIIPDHW